MRCTERKGPRTSEDELIDKLSDGIQKRRSRVKAAPLTPGISAAIVLLNLELGYAPEMMRNALAEPRARSSCRTACASSALIS